MTAGVQCKTCRRFAPSAPPGWLYIVRPAAEPSFMASLGIGPRDEPATFCSMRCLAEWAYVQAVTFGAPAGTEPPPRAGTGWPS